MPESKPEPTRLEILEHAVEIAEKIGAVKNGDHYLEDPTGYAIHPVDIRQFHVDRGDVCGVCIAGAIVVAEVAAGVTINHSHGHFWLEEVKPIAADVASHMDLLPPQEELDELDYTPAHYAVTHSITKGGTQYVVEVLKELVAAERKLQEAVPA